MKLLRRTNRNPDDTDPLQYRLWKKYMHISQELSDYYDYEFRTLSSQPSPHSVLQRLRIWAERHLLIGSFLQSILSPFCRVYYLVPASL